MISIIDIQRGARLKEERRRLKLNQADLAAKLGVSRATQVNYELGKRSPDWGYLSSFGELGADVHYLMLGDRATPGNLYSTAAMMVLPTVAEHAQIDSDALLAILDIASEDEARAWINPKESRLTVENRDSLVAALFEGSKLLSNVFRGVQEVEANLSVRLLPAKRAHVVLTLYSAFIGRKIDKRTIETTVKVALG